MRQIKTEQKAHRKMLIDTFVNAIYLYDDKIIITFNYKDGTKKISFDDVKNSEIGSYLATSHGSDLSFVGSPIFAEGKKATVRFSA